MSNLEGINFWGDWCLEDIILYNVISFVKYGLLEVGAYVNIDKGQVNYLGHDLSRLNPVVGVTGYTDYTIYKGAKSDWIWESNIQLKSTGVAQPNVPSGIFINNAFYPTGVIASGNSYILDFSRGQVVFNSGRSASDTVQVPHSVRLVDVHPKESQEYSQLLSNWNQAVGTGNIDSIRPQTYLPAMFVDVNQLDTTRGLQQGNRAKVSSIGIEFTAVSTSPFDLRKLSSTCYFLETKSFNLYNLANIPFGLDYQGRLINPSAVWPVLSASGLYQGRFQENARMSKLNMSNPLFGRRMNISLEIDTFPS